MPPAGADGATADGASPSYRAAAASTVASCLPTADGIELCRYDWLPAGEPSAVIAVIHGYGEYGGRYLPLADTFAGLGYALSTFDLRGHGRSPGRRGHIDRFDDYIGDTHAFLATLRAQFPACPVYLLGHSLGGLIASRYAEEGDEGLAGLILSSPLIRLALPVSGAKIAAVRLLSHLAPARDIGNTLPAAKLSHDPEIVRAYDVDELNHHVATARWAAEVLGVQVRALADAPSLRLPLLLQYGTADAITDPRGALELYAAAGSTDKTCHGYDDYYHEIYNETGRAAVFADLIAWLERRRYGAAASPLVI